MSDTPRPPRRGALRAPNDLFAALFLLACAAAAWWFGRDLSTGTAFRMGPGYIPRGLTWIVAGFGAVLLVRAFAWPGPPLARWPLRPIVLVLGAMVLFGLTVERAGLLFASAMAVALAALAGQQPRWREVALLAAVLAAAACVLFPWLLQLPLRVLPKWA